jgi:hypothetical protein
MADAVETRSQVRRLYEAAEGELSRARRASRRHRASPTCGGLMTGNVAAAVRIATESFDLAVRNLRVGGCRARCHSARRATVRVGGRRSSRTLAVRSQM